MDHEASLERVIVTSASIVFLACLLVLWIAHIPEQRTATGPAAEDEITQIEIDVLTGNFDEESFGRDFDY